MIEDNRGITVVVPTVGRATLSNTLLSVAPQLTSQDAVVVVSEGENLWVQELVAELSSDYPSTDWSYVVEYGGLWGHPNRNLVMDNYVTTSHVWTIDDDDIATPNAMDHLASHMNDPWTIFRMTFGEGHFACGITCWREPNIVPGDIGTPMIFAPLSNARFGLQYMGDCDYALELQDELGPPVWAEEIVAVIRPFPVDG